MLDYCFSCFLAPIILITVAHLICSSNTQNSMKLISGETEKISYTLQIHSSLTTVEQILNIHFTNFYNSNEVNVSAG